MTGTLLAKKIVARELKRTFNYEKIAALRDYTVPEEWMHSGQFGVISSLANDIVACSGSQGGKALALDTVIPTLDGLKTMGDIEVGDTVFGIDGKPTKVTAVSPVSYGRQCFKVGFDEGSSVVCDFEHLWVTSTHLQRRRTARGGKTLDTVRTTLEISQSLNHTTRSSKCNNHSIPLAVPYDCKERELPIPPYTLGVWLGDGYSDGTYICTADPEILESIKDEGFKVGDGKDCNGGKALKYNIGKSENANHDPKCLTTRLRVAKLLHNKHIPEEYFSATFSDRLSLLQGIMDTDGYVAEDSRCEIACTWKREGLARDIKRLVDSLGIKSFLATRKDHFRIAFSTTLPVCRLKRKLERCKPYLRADSRARFIKSCDEVDSVPVKCIAVDSIFRQYLCTTAYIPTHNTRAESPWLAKEIQRSAPLIRKQGSGRFVYVGPTLTLLAEQAIPQFKDFFVGQEGLGKLVEGTKPRFTFSRNGLLKMFGFDDVTVTITFAYANDSSNLESMTALAAVWDEAGQKENKEASYLALNRRLTVARSTTFDDVLKYAPEWWMDRFYDVEGGDAKFGRRLWGTTPYEWGWFKNKVYDKALAKLDGFELYNWPSWASPMVSEEHCRAQKETMADWQWEMMYMGLFTRPAGIIYDTFTYEDDTVDDFDIPSDWPIYPGVDFGGINTGSVLIAENPDTKDLYCIHEYHAGKQRTYPDHISSIRGKYRDRLWGGAGGSHQEDGWREAFRSNGLMLVEPPINAVDVGIGCVYAQIKTHKLKIFRQSCPKVIDQLLHYSRKSGPDGYPTDEIDDKSKWHLCFVAGTPITTKRGAVPIEKVTPDDLVLTHKGWHRVVSCGLTCASAQVAEVRFSDGRLLEGTLNHPIFVEGIGWKSLGDLCAGDRVLTEDMPENGYAPIYVQQVFVKKDRVPVFNLSVADCNEYFANGVLSHNCDALRYILTKLRPHYSPGATSAPVSRSIAPPKQEGSSITLPGVGTIVPTEDGGFTFRNLLRPNRRYK